MVGDACGVRRRPNRHRRARPERARNRVPEGSTLNSPRPFAYEGLDRIFHERGRLAVCTCLVAHEEGLTFTALATACGLTDGNLNRHLHALAQMKIVRLSRLRGAGRPTTLIRITKTGRARFLAYIDELEAVIRAVHMSSRSDDTAHEPAARLRRAGAHA